MDCHLCNYIVCSSIFVILVNVNVIFLCLSLSRAGSVPPGTTEEQLYYAKKLYDSAFHPDTGDRMNFIGRMSFQVPGGMAITGFMLQFFRSVASVYTVYIYIYFLTKLQACMLMTHPALQFCLIKWSLKCSFLQPNSKIRFITMESKA